MKTSFNEGFSFLLMDTGSTFEEFCNRKAECVPVSVPHDWAISDVELFYADRMGCYIKQFDYTKGNDKARVFLRFDGVYMDSKIYMNGKLTGEWKYGYTSFVVDITDSVIEGNNELIVMVDFKCPNSRWYSGAGIYRNVWLIEEHEVYIPDGGIYVHSNPVSDKLDGDWEVKVSVELSEKWQDGYALEVVLYDGKCVCKEYIEETEVEVSQESCTNEFAKEVPLRLLDKELCEDGRTLTYTFLITSPKLWSIEEPNLYDIELNLKVDNQIYQTKKLSIGFRSFVVTTDKGAFLNGKHIKLNGVCEHHDFGCLGACFYPEAWKRKLCKLREMGVNAIRMSHNPSDPQVYEICDELGFLVMAEAFDMWERPKTEYDYARFFPDWYERDIERFVKDARNHAAVVFYSIGNEIYDTHADERGREVAKNLSDAVKLHDPLGNAYVTLASNYMAWENTQKVADDLKLIGYNYAEKLYKDHHEKHPDWIIYGSETCSIVFSRGVYHFPFASDILAEDDLQCSALGNSATSWGARSLEKCNSMDRDAKFSLGQFIWTGFDYIGEPTPYHTKNSYFGQIDTAGFPKDAFYMWKAAWTSGEDAPFVHVYPYWDFNIGQPIDIRVCSNCDSVELFVNGKSQGGRVALIDNVVNFQALYEPGYIEAVAYDLEGREAARMKRYSFGETDHLEIKENVFGKLHFFELQAIDKAGNPVENACDLVSINVTDGAFLGTDNGDSTDTVSYKSDVKNLFRGKLLVVVEADDNGEASIVPNIIATEKRVRDIKLISTVNEGNIHVTAQIVPGDAKNKEVEFVLADSHGNISGLSKMTYEYKDGKYEVDITPIGDGEYMLRAISKDGYDHAKVISVMPFKNEGLGTLCVSPYEFVAGSTYSRFIGDVTSGNERGVASARDGETIIIYDNIDFGALGSKKINVPIFGLSDDFYELEIWKGVPNEEGAVLLNDDGYQKPSIWNVYQDQDYELNRRLKGINTISFRMQTKLHLKGFTFEESNPIMDRMYAGYADKVYGDQFELQGEKVENIGNNVTIDYGELDFGNVSKKIKICGRDRNGINTLHLRFSNATEDLRTLVEYMPSGDEYDVQEFDISQFKGVGKLEIIFLPGCSFDLNWIEII